MNPENYFYRCSREYVDSIDLDLYHEIISIVSSIPKRSTQAEVNRDLFWLSTSRGWSFDTKPVSVKELPPADLELTGFNLKQARDSNNRSLCKTTTTIEARWRSDFGKLFNGKLVQVEAQFGLVESMFKNFCGFQIAHSERRLALGIEIVMSDPNKYFAHRLKAISGMAYFQVAQKTLPAIGLDCPI